MRVVVDETLVLLPHADGAAVSLMADDDWLTVGCCGGVFAPHLRERPRRAGAVRARS